MAASVQVRPDRDPTQLAWLRSVLDRLPSKDTAVWTEWVDAQLARPAVKTERPCACGCNQQTKSLFAPGHDARLVSQLALGDSPAEAARKVAELGGSESLAEKAAAAVTNRLAKEKAKADRQAAKDAKADEAKKA